MTAPLQVRICVGANHQPDCHHWQYMRQGVEAYLASDEVRNAIRAYGLPIRDGQTGDIVVETMVGFLVEGMKRWLGSRSDFPQC